MAHSESPVPTTTTDLTEAIKEALAGGGHFEVKHTPGDRRPWQVVITARSANGYADGCVGSTDLTGALEAAFADLAAEQS